MTSASNRNSIYKESATSRPVDFDPFADVPELAGTAPATESQQEIWAAASLNREASCAYNECVAITLQGPLDLEALRAALRELVNRHESLRASFGPDGQDLCLAAAIELDLDVVAANGDAELESLREHEVVTPFDLVNGPLFRCRIVRADDERHALLFTAHHTVCDGWSFGVLLRELATLYSDASAGRGFSLPPAPAFSDYARERDTAAQVSRSDHDAWWLEQLRDANTQLELPHDRARPARFAFDAGFVRHVVPAAILAELKKRGARRGCTAYSVIAGVFAAWLHRLTGKDDIIVGVPAAGQANEGLDGLVGHCVSLLPVRSRLNDRDTLETFLDRFGQSMADAWEHRDCSMGRLLPKLGLHRDAAVVPLVQVIFNVDRPIGELDFDGLDVSVEGVPRRYENFEMFVNAVDTVEGLRFDCTFDASLFDEDTIRARLAGLQSFLERLAESDSPVVQQAIVSAHDERVLSGWRHGPSRDWRWQRLEERVREQAEATPDAIAVHAGDVAMDYRTLHERGTRIAHGLAEAGVQPGDIVGVLLERDANLPAALLGVLEAGAAYLPLDPDAPAERLQWMLDDAGVRHVLASQASQTPDEPGALSTFGGRVVDLATLLSTDEEMAPATGDTPGAMSATRSPNHKSPDDIAYVIYTSGSTGKPKGVKVPHRAVDNFLRGMQEILAVSANDRFLALTTLGFDIAVLELWLPLTLGACTDVVARDVARDGNALREHLERTPPSVMQATPATWQLLLAAGWAGHHELTVLSGGEALPAPLARDLCERASRVWNLYGPTETTVWSTAHRVSGDETSVPIGRPIANTEVHVLDAALQPVPPGVPGELYIGGAGVTDGYLNRPELTDERFVDNPHGSGRLYRTGDRVRFDRDGRLEYLGRTDFQIKLRGHRIEPGEIEAALESHPAVERAVAVVREIDGDPRLVAYMTLAGDARVSIGDLRKHMQRSLPAYMLPQHFVDLERMPLTPSGKIDRKQLPSPTALPQRERIPPSTDTEKRIAAIWQDILGNDNISADDNFFDLGGHSLLAARFATAMRERFDANVGIAALFESPVLSDLAASLDARDDEDAEETIEI